MQFQAPFVDNPERDLWRRRDLSEGRKVPCSPIDPIGAYAHLSV